jgi:regulator of sigma E protease
VGQAVARATRETVLISGLIVERLGDLVTRKAAVSENIGGPIAMMRQGAEAAERGIFTYARQIGLLSISLGILNLLPVPVFDGGQLLFLAMEAVRGRPVSGVLRERALQIGVIFVVIAMALAVVNDSSRELKRWLAEP